MKEMALIASKDRNEGLGFVHGAYVCGGEKGFPHIHLYRKTEDVERGAGISIRLDEPEYFDHDGCLGRLDSREKKELNEWLDREDRYISGRTNWQAACEQWNSNNPDLEFDFGAKPDYGSL